MKPFIPGTPGTFVDAAEQFPIPYLPRSATRALRHARTRRGTQPGVRGNSPANDGYIEGVNTSGLAQVSTGGSQWSEWRGWFITDQDLCRHRRSLKAVLGEESWQRRRNRAFWRADNHHQHSLLDWPLTRIILGGHADFCGARVTQPWPRRTVGRSGLCPRAFTGFYGHGRPGRNCFDSARHSTAYPPRKMRTDGSNRQQSPTIDRLAHPNRSWRCRVARLHPGLAEDELAKDRKGPRSFRQAVRLDWRSVC